MLLASHAHQLPLDAQLALLLVDLLELITMIQTFAEDLLEQTAIHLTQQIPYALFAKLDISMLQMLALPAQEIAVCVLLQHQLLAHLA